MDELGPLEEHQIPVCAPHTAAWSRTGSHLGAGQQDLPVSSVGLLKQVGRHCSLNVRWDRIPLAGGPHTEKVFSLV